MFDSDTAANFPLVVVFVSAFLCASRQLDAHRQTNAHREHTNAQVHNKHTERCTNTNTDRLSVTSTLEKNMSVDAHHQTRSTQIATTGCTFNTAVTILPTLSNLSLILIYINYYYPNLHTYRSNFSPPLRLLLHHHNTHHNHTGH